MTKSLIARGLAALAAAALFTGLATSAHAEFNAEVKYTQVGDIKMAYHIRVQGSALLMINGFASTVSPWNQLFSMNSQGITR